MGICFVFADIMGERAILRNLMETLALIGGGAFLVFLLISVMLSGWAVKPVEKAWRQQKQFVADASHELKTPLTVIMTDANLLDSDECSHADRRKLSAGIISMSDQMRGLVESLLELARMDDGSVGGEVGRVSLSGVIQETAMIFEPVFFEKGMLFSYEIEPDIFLNGMETQLKQLADILLENASKYGRKDGRVEVTLHRLSAKKCRLCVSNQGEAIGEEDLKNLFKRFYRADRARTGCHSYGLGLSIAESIVQAHHGVIWAESRDGYNRFL